MEKQSSRSSQSNGFRFTFSGGALKVSSVRAEQNFAAAIAADSTCLGVPRGCLVNP